MVEFTWKITIESKRSKISERFDFFIKIKLTGKLRFLEGRLLIMLRLGLIVRLRRMVRLVVRLRRMVRLMVRFWNISLPCLALDIVLVVTGSDVFIEEGAVSTVKGVLLSVCVAEMINLKYHFTIILLFGPDRNSQVQF